jgi:exodeoxyribonuclease VII small subunit
MSGTKKGESKEALTFEKAFERLEEIVGLLEKGGGDLGLEESLKLFEEGTKLAHFCRGKLDEAERKIEILTREEGGKTGKAPFDEPKETGEDDR